MDTVRELQAIRTQLKSIDTVLDQLIRRLEEAEVVERSAPSRDSSRIPGSYESIYPLSNPAIFKGQKPTGVLFGENDRVDTGTWKRVCETILKRCDADPEKHVELMNLRGRISGRERVFLAKSPDGMRSPRKINENLYMETNYDAETLMRILVTRILDTVGYDYRCIRIAIRNSR